MIANVPVSPDVADKRPAASIASPCCTSSSRKRAVGEHVTFWGWDGAQSTPLDENERHKVKSEDSVSEFGPVAIGFDQIVSWTLGPGLDSTLLQIV